MFKNKRRKEAKSIKTLLILIVGVLIAVEIYQGIHKDANDTSIFKSMRKSI